MVISLFCYLLIALFILVIGWENASYLDIEKAQEQCSNNGGLMGIELDTYNIDVYCRNGAVYENDYIKTGEEMTFIKWLKK